MIPDRDETTTPDDNGVLADPGHIDPTGIDFGGAATAQVNVVLPDNDDDDDAIDDVIEGEVVTGEQPLIVTASLEWGSEPEPADAPATAAAAPAPGVDTDIDVTEEPENVIDAREPVQADAGEAAEQYREETTVNSEAGAPSDAADGIVPNDNASEDSASEDSAPEDMAPTTGAADDSEVEMPQQTPGRAVDHADERVRTPVQEPVTFVSKRLGELDESRRESADLLTADRLLEPGHTHAGEPEGLWQQLVYAASFHRVNLGDGKKARERKELAARISAPLPGRARFVPVLSRKGGVGKTTVTALLGMALADARDDRVIAVDANPDRGTLADRIARASGRTVRDLARASGDITGFADISAIVARDQTRLDVLASDADPHVSEAFNDGDYADVAELAAHYYSVVLTDTGTGIVHSVMGATLERAHQLVVVAGLSVDEARLASETLTWLETNGYAEQVRQAIVVLNTARPGTPLVRADELEAHFRSRVRDVVRMPYDPAIASGSSIVFRDLQPNTRRAARELAATVIEGLRAGAALV